MMTRRCITHILHRSISVDLEMKLVKVWWFDCLAVVVVIGSCCAAIAIVVLVIALVVTAHQCMY